MSKRVFGQIASCPPGTMFRDRADLADAGVHRPTQAGISGSGPEGADSIVVSGGYEDDLDEGAWIVYTGHGGNDSSSKRQVANQEMTRQNLALAKSAIEGLPVRVIRGANPKSRHAPIRGYRYDGLYRVDQYWSDIGRSGFVIWRFLLRSIEASHELYGALVPQQGEDRIAERRPVLVQRIIRSTPVVAEVKKLNDYLCQVCRVELKTNAGPYAEGAHIRPLGRPHNGPDTAGNVLCLCPNHHVLFDRGAFAVKHTHELIGLKGTLHTVRAHVISPEHLDYHLRHCASLKVG